MHPAWERYRRLRTRFSVAGAAWLAAAPVALVLTRLYGSSEVAFALLMAAAVVACLGYAVTVFECPQCGWLFFRGSFSLRPFDDRCRNCGLRKWADPAAGPVATAP
jgi:hypothetical protein